MSIKMLIPVKIKLRGEERGGAFRSIIYDKLKKLRISKKKNILIHQLILFKITNKSITTFSRNKFTYNFGETVRKLAKSTRFVSKTRNRKIIILDT